MASEGGNTKRRKSLAAGQARRDRFPRARAGTGRMITEREVGYQGRQTGMMLPAAKKDANGFDDLDDVFGEDGDVSISESEADFSHVTDVDPSMLAPSGRKPGKGMGWSTAKKTAGLGAGMDSPSFSPSPVAAQSGRKKSRKQTEEELAKRLSFGGALSAATGSPAAPVVSDEQSESDNDMAMDNDFEAPMDYDEPEEEGEVVAAKQASKKTMTKAEKKAQRKRRRTLPVIREARVAGLDKVIAPSLPAQDGVRRGKRVRFKPLQHWRGEKLTVSMKAEGVGAMIPTVDLDNPVEKLGAPTPAPRKARSRTKKKKSAAAKKQQEEEDEDDGVEREELDPGCWVFDVVEQEDRFKIVGKSEPMISLETLHQPQPKGAPAVPASKMPQGGKAFEEHGFSSGLLVLPGGAVKNRELTHNDEVHYVVAAETNCLEVVIRSKTMLLSRGDSFIVPSQNEYTLRNLSKKRPVKLFFTLIKSALPLAMQAGNLPVASPERVDEAKENKTSRGSKKSSKGKKKSKKSKGKKKALRPVEV